MNIMTAKEFKQQSQLLIDEYIDSNNIFRKKLSLPSTQPYTDYSNEIINLYKNYDLSRFYLLYLGFKWDFIKVDGYTNFAQGESYALFLKNENQERICYAAYDELEEVSLLCSNSQTFLQILYLTFKLKVFRAAQVVSLKDRDTHEQYLNQILQLTNGAGYDYFHYSIMTMNSFY